MKLFRAFILFFIIQTPLFLNAQVDFGVRLISVTASPFTDENKSLDLRYLGTSSVFSVEPGLLFSAAIFTDERTSFQASFAGYNDKAGMLAGFGSLHLKYKIAKKYKHSLTAGIGPSIFFRQSWENIEGYTETNVYDGNAGSQTRMAWLSGEIAYNYYLSKSSDLYFSVVRTSPLSFGFTAGAVFQLGGKKSRYSRKKGCDCPSYR